ncbi:hypothetical protein MEBOL_005457 [Melittangium boletus DSM 14713]|uniref:Uncharacterized protein n=1 Tax=Melittangium boletus DSM 14713 TaxID=1294270 RepID=A0A250IJQ2_9BACT|nr:hypothetical protein MEBOL_005457 [Melittangium boletus DSM 14713]
MIRAAPGSTFCRLRRRGIARVLSLGMSQLTAFS